MSDSATFRAALVPGTSPEVCSKVCDALEIESLDDGYTTIDDVNYPGRYIDALRAVGCPFLAAHGRGDEYEACVYAFDGKKLYEAFILDGHMAVQLNADGALNPLQHQDANDIIDFWKKHSFPFSLMEFCS